MLQIIRTNSNHPHFRQLVQLLDKELWSRYEDEMKEYDPHNKIENNRHIVIAYIGDEAVGCGCFKAFDPQTVELKRMFVKPEHRGKHIAGFILNELEQWARKERFKRLVLETGIKQPEAIRLYQREGFVVIDNFEPYKGMETSICMEKVLK